MAGPNLFIIGAPKCGTSSLFHYLSQHTDVHRSPRKEPHYLAHDLQWNDGWGVTSKEKYQRLYDSTKKISIDASTWYLYSRTALRSISEDYPDSKVIICLRHPVNFMESMWWHMRSRGKDTSESLMKALEKERAVKNGLDFFPAPFRKSVLYREAAGFSSNIKRYIEELGLSRIKIVLLEDISKSIETVMIELSDFLDIPYEIPSDLSVKNRACRAEYLWLRVLMNKNKRLGHCLRATPLRKLRSGIKSIGRHVGVNNEIEFVRLSQTEWFKLRDEMYHEIDQLSVILDRDLSHWQQGPVHRL